MLSKLVSNAASKDQSSETAVTKSNLIGVGILPRLTLHVSLTLLSAL